MNLLEGTKDDDPVLGTLNKATAAAKKAGDKIKNVTGDVKKEAEKKAAELKGKIDEASQKSKEAVEKTLQKAKKSIEEGDDEWKRTQGENLWDKLVNYLLSFFKNSATAVKETANKVKETSEKAAQDLKSGMAATAPPAPAAPAATPPPQTGGRKFKKNQKEIYNLLRKITLAAIKSNKKKRKTKKMRKKHKRKTKRRGRKSRNKRTKRRRTKRRR